LARQKLNEESGGRINPLLIFPESTTTNGTHLIGFKRGAFVGERRVKPMVVVQSPEATVSLAQVGFTLGIKDVLPIVFMHLSWLGVQTLELKVLPDFEPNDYLFANHADKGEERWQIYAWAVKDIMAKAGNFGKSE
jgi:hypothetical protein